MKIFLIILAIAVLPGLIAFCVDLYICLYKTKKQIHAIKSQNKRLAEGTDKPEVQQVGKFY